MGELGAVEGGQPVVSFSVDSDGIGLLLLQRPHAKNAVHDWLYESCMAALAEAAASDACKLVVISGAGDFFSAGADLQAGFDPLIGELKSMHGSRYDPVGRFISTVIAFPKPLVAAINGPAVGIGATIVPHCDVSFASETAYFWTPFANLCVCPEACSSITFPAILGQSLGNEMLYFGKRLSAAEAKAAGFVSDVLPVEGFLEAVMARLRPTCKALNAGKSFKLFKGLIKGPEHIARMEAAHRREMAMLDQRSTGPTSDAFLAVAKMNRDKKQKKAKL